MAVTVGGWYGNIKGWTEAIEYRGGELCIDTPLGPQRIKLPAGHAILYPSGSLHSVAEVSEGERLVALTWVQSLVRHAEQRDILAHLDIARESLADSGNPAALKHVDLCYANLFRMWAEP